MFEPIYRSRPGADALSPACADAAEQIAPGLWCSPGLSNAYLLTTDEGRIIVNTGMGFEGPSFADSARTVAGIVALILGRLPARPFVGLVAADQATGPCPERTVMPGIMAGDAADRRALEAAGGLRRTGREGACRQHQRRCDCQRFHVDLLLLGAIRRALPSQGQQRRSARMPDFALEAAPPWAMPPGRALLSIVQARLPVASARRQIARGPNFATVRHGGSAITLCWSAG